MRGVRLGYATEACLGLVAAASLFGAMAALGVTSHLCVVASLGVVLAACAVSRALRRCDGRAALAAAALPIQVALPAFYLAAISDSGLALDGG